MTAEEQRALLAVALLAAFADGCIGTRQPTSLVNDVSIWLSLLMTRGNPRGVSRLALPLSMRSVVQRGDSLMVSMTASGDRFDQVVSACRPVGDLCKSRFQAEKLTVSMLCRDRV